MGEVRLSDKRKVMPAKNGYALIVSTHGQFLNYVDNIMKELEYTGVQAPNDVLAYSKFKNQEFSLVAIHVTQQNKHYIRLITQLKGVKTAKVDLKIAILAPKDFVSDPTFPNLKGQAFVIEYDDPNEINALVVKKAISSSGGPKTPEEALSGKSVLLVDDEEMVRSLLREFLEDYGCKITEAKNGDEAVRLSLTQKFDFVLLDFMMPGMNGDKVLELIRKKYTPKELPVLVASGQSDMDNIKRLTALGINGYVVKPIDLNTLVAKITNAIK